VSTGTMLDRIASIVSLIAAIAVLGVAFTLYRQRPTPPAPKPLPKVPVSLEHAALQGSDAAPVILIDFSDFQCPFCRDFAQQVLPQVIRSYVTPGKVQLAFMPFPLTRIHPFAFRAAEEALCAAAQGRFWEMHDQLFQAPELTERALAESPAAIGLRKDAFDSCIASASTERLLKAAMERAESLGVSGTPTFFLGVRSGVGAVRVVGRIARARSFDEVASELNPVIAANNR
jgi:protein-disulfide isomerase